MKSANACWRPLAAPAVPPPAWPAGEGAAVMEMAPAGWTAAAVAQQAAAPPQRAPPAAHHALPAVLDPPGGVAPKALLAGQPSGTP